MRALHSMATDFISNGIVKMKITFLYCGQFVKKLYWDVKVVNLEGRALNYVKNNRIFFVLKKDTMFH